MGQPVSTELPLFVYGTLTRDGPMAHLLGTCRRGPATVRGRLWHLRAGYPALTLDGDDLVHGEWVEGVAPAVLAVLDTYEGVSEGLFRRAVVMATPVVAPARAPRGVAIHQPAVAPAPAFRAWAWVMDDLRHRGARRVPSGRWRPIRAR